VSETVTVTNLAPRLERTIEALENADRALALSMLVDLRNELFGSPRCDLCDTELTFGELNDANAMRRHGEAGICKECAHAHSWRAAA
jgi:hypothetical protein